MRRSWLALVALAALAAGLIASHSVHAHAALVSSEPANNDLLRTPPERVVLVFTEPVDPRSSGIRLLDAAGRDLQVPEPEFIDNGFTMRLALPKLPPGIYNVVWYNVSKVDGHGYRGSFPFTVLNPDGSAPDVVNTVGGFGGEVDPPPRADGVAVRALALLGLLAGAGAGLMALLWREATPAARRGFERLAYAATALLLVAVGLNLVVIRDEFGGVPLADVVFRTRIGGYWLTRFGATLLIGVTAGLLIDAPRRAAVGVLAGVGLFTWSFAATSHAAAGTGSSWGTIIDFTHGIAALAWIGALIGFAFAVRMAGREGDYARLLPRFSLLASVAVFVLLCSGLLSSFIQFDTPDRLGSTRYGVTMLVKLGLMAPLLGLALYNATRGRRALLAPGGTRQFILTAGAEALLGLAVFVPAAMLTQTFVAKSVPEEQDVRPFNETQPASDLQVSLAVDPNRVGLNSYFVRLRDGAGAPVAAERVRLTFRSLEDQTLGQATLTLARAPEAGNFSGQGPFFTAQGRWRVEVEVRRAEADDVKAFFDVRPAGPVVVSSSRGGAWDNPAAALSWNEFGGIALLMAAVGLAIWRRPLGALDRRLGWTTGGMTVLGFTFGAMLLFGVHKDPAPEGLPTNPIPADANSLATGKRLYEQNCAACHGLNGVPPPGLELKPYPLDLTVHVPQHPDGQVYQFIAKGIPGTAMRAWGEGEGRLSDEEIWHIVNYLRTFSAADR